MQEKYLLLIMLIFHVLFPPRVYRNKLGLSFLINIPRIMLIGISSYGILRMLSSSLNSTQILVFIMVIFITVVCLYITSVHFLHANVWLLGAANWYRLEATLVVEMNAQQRPHWFSFHGRRKPSKAELTNEKEPSRPHP